MVGQVRSLWSSLPSVVQKGYGVALLMFTLFLVNTGLVGAQGGTPLEELETGITGHITSMTTIVVAVILAAMALGAVVITAAVGWRVGRRFFG